MRIARIRIGLWFLGLAACGQATEGPLDEVRALVVDSLGEDLSLIGGGIPPLVQKAIVKVGKAPNQALLRNGEVLVLSSLSNSLQVIDPETWTVSREYSLGDGCSPYWMALDHEGLLVITCNQANQLLRVDPAATPADDPVKARMDLPAGEDLRPFPGVSGFARPQGVAVVGAEAYVTLTNLDETWAPAGPGMVVVVDVAAWVKVKVIETTKENPGFIYAPADGERLFVSCLGAYDGQGKVDVLDVASRAVVSTIDIRNAPGRMWLDGDGVLWVGDHLDGRLLRYQSATDQLLEPTMLCPADAANGIYDFISDVATDNLGNLFAACFASDQVFWFKPGSFPEGGIAIEAGDGPQALLVIQR